MIGNLYLLPVNLNPVILIHIWLIFRVNVGKYNIPMDPMGLEVDLNIAWLRNGRTKCI